MLIKRLIITDSLKDYDTSKREIHMFDLHLKCIWNIFIISKIKFNPSFEEVVCIQIDDEIFKPISRNISIIARLAKLNSTRVFSGGVQTKKCSSWFLDVIILYIVHWFQNCLQLNLNITPNASCFLIGW